jgi:hypothetical protein
VLLGGQQRTVKFAGAMELKTDEQRQDAVRGALGAKIVAPYVSASFQYSKGRGSGSSRKDEEYADLSYLGMSASGGDTLIGAEYGVSIYLFPLYHLPYWAPKLANLFWQSVPRWAKTVGPPENWRVIGVSGSKKAGGLPRSHGPYVEDGMSLADFNICVERDRGASR